MSTSNSCPLVGGLKKSNDTGPSPNNEMHLLKIRNASLDHVFPWLVLVDYLGLEAAEELQRRLVQLHHGNFATQTHSCALSLFMLAWAFHPGGFQFLRKNIYSSRRTR